MTGDGVGYRSPPKSGRFVKGRSGNPHGRPRRPTVVVGAAGESEYDAMFLEELNRKVSVRDGENIEKMSLERAATRAIALKAAKGDVKAFSALRAKREAIENRRGLRREEYSTAILEYKAQATQELRRRNELCEAGLEIIPHPDDILVDPITGAIVFNGPLTPEQKMSQDLLVSRWPAVEREWRNSPQFIAKEPWILKRYAKLKRQIAIVDRLVAKRASKMNSWDSATPEERLEFLRRSHSQALSKIFPAGMVRSELCFKLAFQDWLGIQPTDEERQAFLKEARQVLLTG